MDPVTTERIKKCSEWERKEERKKKGLKPYFEETEPSYLFNKTHFPKITYDWKMMKGLSYHSHHLSDNSTRCSKPKKKRKMKSETQLIHIR